MNKQRMLLPQQLPAKDSQRNCTDCFFAIIGILFILGMFVFSCLQWKKQNFNVKLSQILLQSNNQCSGQNRFVLFNDSTNITIKQCVSQCPPGYQQSKWKICFSTIKQEKQKLLTNLTNNKIGYINSLLQTIFYVVIITFGWGLLIMTFTHCLPRYMPMINIFLAVSLLILIAVFTIITKFVSHFIEVYSIILAAVFIFIATILIITLCFYSNQIKFQGYMLEYSVKFLNQSSSTFLYIPIFIILHAALLLLILFQHFSFVSKFGINSSFWIINHNWWLGILNIVQYLWGLQFLKDSFNFCVSGNAVDWYWTKQFSCYKSFNRLLCKNIGSIAIGSFLNIFLIIPSLIIQILTCHPNTCCGSIGNFCYNACSYLTCWSNLVRTDVYSYINIAGIGYCEGAKQCRQLCQNSNLFIGYYSPMRHYRMIGQIGSVLFVFVWAILILNYRTKGFGLWNLVILVILIYGNIVWFTKIHADVGEGLQTSYLTQLHLQKGEHQFMQKLLPSIRKILQPLQNRQLRDGNC